MVESDARGEKRKKRWAFLVFKFGRYSLVSFPALSVYR